MTEDLIGPKSKRSKADKRTIRLENKRLCAKVVERDSAIIDMCRDKEVLHLGCADYPYSYEQHHRNGLFHEKLSCVSKRLVGIDSSKAGIDFLRSLGYKNLYVGDVEDEQTFAAKGKFDIIIAGEILEHLSNVGRFFDNIITTMHEESLLVISVPNAHAIKSFIRVFFKSELVHPDHVYYFSPATIEHLCKRYGAEIVRYYYYFSRPSSLPRRIIFFPLKILLLYLSPYVGDGLVFVIRKRV